jgi:ribonuclease P protein component
VLPAAYRLRSSADFAAVTRRGRKARCGALVVHLLAEPARTGNGQAFEARSLAGPLSPPSRVGLVVAKSVGGSVVRHQVSRRLRAQLSQRLDVLPPGSRLVVRALPETAMASSSALGHDLDRALRRLTTGTGR